MFREMYRYLTYSYTMRTIQVKKSSLIPLSKSYFSAYDIYLLFKFLDVDTRTYKYIGMYLPTFYRYLFAVNSEFFSLSIQLKSFSDDTRRYS